MNNQSSDPKRKTGSPKSDIIVKISVSAMFLALALAVKLIGGFYIPIFGGNGMRVGFAGVFSFFPAILFGPIYGGAVSGLLDILGYVIKPDGAFIPFLTITAVLGGILKGIIWRLINAGSDSEARAKIRAVIAVCFALIAAFGVFSHVSLIKDGVTNGFIAEQNKLPTHGQTMSMQLSRQSDFIISLAQYNNDTITLTKTELTGVVTLPSEADIDGFGYRITKLASDAFVNASEITELHIPASYTKIEDGALDGLDEAVIRDDDDQTEEKNRITVTSDNMSADGFTVKSSDTWRKYLAGYINFITVGLEIIGAAGLIFAGIDLLLAKTAKKKEEGRQSLLADSLKVFVTIFIPGMIVTTINTEILKWYLTAWNGRSFIILWVPRLIEEMLVCMVQAYIISVLYDVYEKRIAKKLISRNIH